MTPAAVLSARAFRIVLPDGEAHRVVAPDEAAAKRLLRSKLEITRLPAGCTIERWEQAEPVLVEAPDAEEPDLALDLPAEPAPKKPAKASKVAWKDFPPAELAAYLLEHVTLGDAQWQHRRPNGETRAKGEKRDAFIRRCLLPGGTPTAT